ncbi:rod shape-determining protein RodA [bacterium]|nr:rod shape-determining protein RodA [bacterium]
MYLGATSRENRTSRISFFVLIPIVLLSIIGLIALYSTTILPEGGVSDLSIVKKQAITILVGFIIYYASSYVSLSIIKYWQFLAMFYIGCIGLLVATLLFGPVINNVQRWLIIGGIQIQPSEVVKILVILITAGIFSYKDKYNEFLLFAISAILILPILFLIYMQPSGTMTILTFAIWFTLAFLGLRYPVRNTILLMIIISLVLAFVLPNITGNKLYYLLSIIAVVSASFGFFARNNWRIAIIASVLIGLVLGGLASIAWSKVLKDYQKERIEAYFSPEETKDDTGFNVNQSKIAIGSGQLWGKGFGNGTQSKRNFLPEYQTDFIFASYAEEFGFVGCMVLILLYTFLISLCFVTAVKCVDNQHFALICIGIGVKLMLEVFVNLGTDIGTIPATGIPLPLMSSGGTITLVTLLEFGIIQNIIVRTSKKSVKKNTSIIKVYED